MHSGAGITDIRQKQKIKSLTFNDTTIKVLKTLRYRTSIGGLNDKNFPLVYMTWNLNSGIFISDRPRSFPSIISAGGRLLGQRTKIPLRHRRQVTKNNHSLHFSSAASFSFRSRPSRSPFFLLLECPRRLCPYGGLFHPLLKGFFVATQQRTTRKSTVVCILSLFLKKKQYLSLE